MDHRSESVGIRWPDRMLDNLSSDPILIAPPSQRSRIVHAAGVAAAVFVLVAGLVWVVIWLVARLV